MSQHPAAEIRSRIAGPAVWLAKGTGPSPEAILAGLEPGEIQPDVLDTEDAVGRAMLDELESAARSKKGDLVVVLLGGRGAQSLHRLLGERAKRGKDELITRLRVFTQDALAPMSPANSFSFVRDFERLLGPAFFEQVGSFTSMRTAGPDFAKDLEDYVRRLENSGGVDIFFLGHGPEPEDASHLAYIKPGSGASASDLAGVIPVSESILKHHIAKFKAGGSKVTDADEAECRRVTHILTLGPAAILGARRIVQSIVDADTAPAKRRSYRRVVQTVIEREPVARARQLDQNPGLWLRLHPNVRSLVLPDLIS